MDAELKSELVKWLSGTREFAGKMSDSAVAEMHGFVGDMVTLGRLETTLWMLLWVVALVVGVSLAWVGVSKLPSKPAATKEEREQLDDAGSLFVAGLATTAVTLLVIACSLHSFFAAWFASRVYVVEHLAELVNKVNGK